MYAENELNTVNELNTDTDFEVEGECAVCCAVHDEETHRATLSIRTWFRRQVTHDFQGQPVYLPAPVVQIAAA
jgi:hypothetical protein